MKVFEFYFNPKLKKDSCLETFCFSPTSKKEEKMGNLYLVGELKNSLPRNRNFLEDLAEIIKNEYYILPKRENEESFKKSLAKANHFLEKELKKENTDWLGNLSFFVCQISDFSALFSKTGDLKVFLSREGKIFNIGESQTFSFSQKTFSNLIEGKLNKEDKILVLTQELFEGFWENRVFEEFKNIKKPKELKKLFKQKKEILKELFGVLLFVFIKKERKKIYLNLPRIPLPSFGISQKIFPQNPFLRERFKKGLLSLLILIFLLVLGYLLFQ